MLQPDGLIKCLVSLLTALSELGSASINPMEFLFASFLFAALREIGSALMDFIELCISVRAAGESIG